ncbi:hypothetical protein [Aquimarina muelleri]|uniref:Uncharacterized protein n=1 Tax=Aquimarina muelleri TaxID=279356 RepID=A0A918JTC9_9FLAO|nr:hypothetical protein [Aquimarina muelleri]MCX2763908.1 hypothetical protein [Aquimarina muelleri]GGX11061.1 hypothetical protein GCM10007384_11020 [Aquimarina muelleri]
MKQNITSNTINKVTKVLSKLQNEYPEVYSLLDEEPFGHLIGTEMGMNNDTLINYLTDIEELLQQLNSTRIS